MTLKHTYLLAAASIAVLLAGAGCVPETTDTNDAAARHSSATTTPAFTDGKTVESTENDFSISYPGTWTLKTDDPDYPVKIFAPNDNASDTYSENVRVMVNPLKNDDTDLATMVDIEHADLQSGSGYKEMEYADDTIDGIPAKRIVHGSTIDGKDYVFFLEILVYKHREYVFTAATKPAAYAAYRDTFDKMAHSMKLF